MTQPLTIYFAGELFSLKHLTGNALLADAIQKISQNKFSCVVPQDLEQRETTPLAIRNQDLFQVVSCDLGLFNFDGPELDSGTVVEFLVAKMLDIPSVIVRSDFRSAGDARALPWNLMLIDYPRTKVLVLDGMAHYQRNLRQEGTSPVQAAQAATNELARDIISAFDDVIATPAVLSPELRPAMYEWVRHFAGASFAKLLTESSLQQILQSKIARGLL
jgi:nucleoside 2-deoxyribosyltransferase